MLSGGVPTLFVNHAAYQGMTLLYLALDAEGNWRAVCDGGYIHRDREKKDEKVKPNVLVTYQMDKRRYKKKLEWHPVDVEILGYVR
jgi:NADH:ubiquinone oxidoreductase subunit D